VNNRTLTSTSRNNGYGYTRTSYIRFGKRKSDRSCNQNLQDFDSDSDQVEVELSGITNGITNRLYSTENEEIYHIT
jgi:hypothetical protein